MQINNKLKSNKAEPSIEFKVIFLSSKDSIARLTPKLEFGYKSTFFKGAQVGGANLGSFCFSFIFSHKQRLRPLGYWAPQVL